MHLLPKSSRTLAALVLLALVGLGVRAKAADAPPRTLRIGVYMDDGWQQAATGRARFSAALAAAGLTLAPTLEAGASLIGVRPWKGRRSGTAATLLDALDEAHAAQPWPEVDLAVLLISTPPARANTPTEWAYATLGRPLGVMRTLRAHRDPDDPVGLARAEALQVTRILAGVLGALPPCSAEWMWRDLSVWPVRDEWAPNPQVLEQRTLSAVRTALGPSLRDPLGAPLAQRLLAGLRAIPETAQRCQPEVFNARARLLEALTMPAPAQAPAPNSSPPACESTSTPPSVRCIGLTLAQRGRDADAVRWLRAALDERSDDVEVRLTLARSLGRAGDDSAALALLEAHVIEQPIDARAWLNLGVAAARLGRIERAREAWSEVLRLDPGQTDAAALLKSLSPRPARLPSAVNP